MRAKQVVLFSRARVVLHLHTEIAGFLMKSSGMEQLVLCAVETMPMRQLTLCSNG
jgi:hypothetical protein